MINLKYWRKIGSWNQQICIFTEQIVLSKFWIRELKWLTIPNLYAFTFDLQKALPFPMLQCSVAYYKRNMYVYNLGCHGLPTGNGFIYVWDEQVALRGSLLISSWIFKHLHQRPSNSVEQVVMFSNCCGGQNQNIKIMLTCTHYMQ